jgi:hypothetical protein
MKKEVSKNRVEIEIPSDINADRRVHLARWLRRVAKDVLVFGDEYKRRKTPIVYREEEK